MKRAAPGRMRISPRLLPFITATLMLANPLGMLMAHSRCVDDRHACGQAMLVDRCCCHVLDTRSPDPATTPTLAAVPPILLAMPDRAEALTTTSAMLRVPQYPPLAGHVSLNTLFATLLI